MYQKTLSPNLTIAIAWTLAVGGLAAFIITGYLGFPENPDIDAADRNYMWFRALVAIALSGGLPCLIVSWGVAVATLFRQLPLWYLLMSAGLVAFAPLMTGISALILL